MQEVNQIKCDTCRENLQEDPDKLGCSKCKKYYHYYCQSYTEKAYKRLTVNAKKVWKCKECSNTTEEQQKPSKQDNSNPTFDFAQMKEFFEDLMNKHTQITNARMDQLTMEIKDKVAEEMCKKLQGIEESMQFISNKFEEINKELGEVKRQNKTLTDETKELKAVNKSLETRIQDCERILLEQTAKELQASIEISNIPERERENLKDLAQRIADLIEIPEQNMTIQEIKRANTGKYKQRNIQIRLATNQDRSTWIQQAKKTYRKMTLNNLMETEAETRIYINEQTSPQLKKLLWETKLITKELNYKFVWIKDGALCTRAQPGSKVYRITSTKDLQKLPRHDSLAC